MSQIDLIFLDNSNNIIEEGNVIKPEKYQQLLKILTEKFKNKSEYNEIFIIDKNNKEIKIANEENFYLIEDMLFIREIDREILKKSIFEMNYNRLSESKREVLDEKYNCILCSIIVKNEKPYFCYQCQKIFHEKCLKDWDKKCQLQNKILMCPNCRIELEIEKWNKKLDYEENRIENANFLDIIKEYKSFNNMNNIINKIKDKKIKKLEDNLIINKKLIEKYENYINQTIEIFKNILLKINNIHISLKIENNKELNDLINKYPLNYQNLEMTHISKIINDELENFNIHLKHNVDNEIKENKELIIKNNKNSFNLLKSENENDKDIEEPKDLKINQYKDKINIIFKVNKKDSYQIFGNDFLNNNKDNIELLKNGEKINLASKCELKEGDNIITLILKNKLTNLSRMFYWCNNLKDIRELEYLYVNEVKDFSYIFFGCSKLTDINPLKNWDVSNGKNFTYLFSGCSSLSNIKPIENWNMSNGINFSYMFSGCSSLSDITPLKNWNVSNGNNFTYMFSGCSSLSDITSLQNWDMSNGTNFSWMFSKCISLSDIKPLKNWNVSNGNNFSFLFYECSSLSDIEPLQNWNVSNCKNFSWLFSKCKSLLNINPLLNWNVSKGNNFKSMFLGCSAFLDISSLKIWNISKSNAKELFGK